MSPKRPAKLVVCFVFVAALLAWGVGSRALPSEALAQDAFLGAQGSASAPPGIGGASPYRPGVAPAGASPPADGITPGQVPDSAKPAPPLRPAAPAGGLDLLDQGEFAAASGRFAEAERLWRQALAQNPNRDAVKHRLAELPGRRAVYASDLAQQEQRRQARLALVEGVTHFNAHEYQAAAQDFQHYLAVFPEDAEIRAHLDMALRQGASLTHGTLRVACEPKAEIFLDGLLAGRTPLALPQVMAGSHRVEVRAFGGSQAIALAIHGGQTTEVSFRLLGGFLAVNAEPWAEVLLDGQPVGQTPLTLENLVLGPHQIDVRHSDLPEQARQVFLESGRTQSLHFNLTPH